MSHINFMLKTVVGIKTKNILEPLRQINVYISL